MKVIVIRAARGCEASRAQVMPQGDPMLGRRSQGVKASLR